MLAAASMLGLIVQPGLWLYRTAFEDVTAIVTPICERYVLGQANGSTARYLGVNIYAVKPILNARVRFSDTLSVVQWGLYSDGLSDSETQSFVSELPKGKLLNPFLTPPLPALSVETSTTLTMLAVAANEECRGRDPYWVEVTTSQGDVYHINPNVTQVREFPSLFLEAHWAMAAAYYIALGFSWTLDCERERWTPSFGQVFVTAKVESGFMIQATLGCSETGRRPGL